VGEGVDADFKVPIYNAIAFGMQDLDKEQESHGYEVLVVWESEWHKTPDHVIKKCIDFIND
jgi:hypothetical protein